MTGPLGPLVVIAGPSMLERMPAIERRLDDLGLEHRTIETTEPGDGARWSRACLLAGERFLVAAGGDSLVHDVVNGMFDGGAPVAERPILGVLPSGADDEFFRQFGLPMDAERACAHLAGEGLYAIDVARVECDGSNRGRNARMWINIADVGLGADVAARAARRTGRARQFLAFWSALARAKRSHVQVEAARQRYDGEAYHVVVGNGRHGAGGFRVSPRSFPGDGVLEVLVHHGPKAQAFTSLPKSIRGEQVPSLHIAELRGNRVRIDADPPMTVAVDGHVVGTTPASFEVLPQAIHLKI